MRVVIAGAGSVGRSIARELLRNGHHVLLVDRDADGERVQKVPDASWLQADACEIAQPWPWKRRSSMRSPSSLIWTPISSPHSGLTSSNSASGWDKSPKFRGFL